VTRQPDLAHAARLAARCLVRMQVTALPVQPIDILRRCRNTVIYTYRQAAESIAMGEYDFERRCAGADAFTIRGSTHDGQRAYVVCYRAGGNPARLNFTLAHELGHIVLSHQGGDPADEAEANCFAQHLLCPAPVLHRLQKEGHLTPQHIARACYVSLAAGEAAIKNFLKSENFFENHELEKQFFACSTKKNACAAP